MKKFLAISGALLLLFMSCDGSKNTSDQTVIGVFVPGTVSGNPVYEMLVSGVLSAVNEYNAQFPDKEPVRADIIEAGTAQSEWSGKLTAITAEGKYDVIISSNPSLPEIIELITAQFPEQKFIIVDAYLAGNPNVATARYNQREEAYLAGYMAGLVTGSSMEFANKPKKIGFIAAQEYPVMNEVLLPSFTEGAKAADPDVTVDFRVVGNWSDASKAAELARSMYNGGVDVILSIAGGANQGVLATARELGFYIVWFDENGFSKAPGYVVSSAVIKQEKMAKEMTREFLNGEIEFGTARTQGMRDGYVDFITDDPLYLQTVPQNIRDDMAKLLADIRSGKLNLPYPEI